MLDKSSDTPGFTARAAVIAVVLSLFLLASSTYIAVKIGALPWPIVFSVIVSGGIIKLLNRRRPVNIHEINVAQAALELFDGNQPRDEYAIDKVRYLRKIASPAN